jgi:hypothetical protein
MSRSDALVYNSDSELTALFDLLVAFETRHAVTGVFEIVPENSNAAGRRGPV